MRWPRIERPRRTLLIALGIAALLAFLANIWFLLPTSAPSTRSLIRQAAATVTPIQSSIDAQRVLCFRGTAALPGLIEAVQKRDSKVEDLYMKLNPELPEAFQRVLPVPVVPWQVRSVAAFYLGGLGPAAKPAVPPLIALTHSTNIVGESIPALDALGRIGPGAEEAAPRLRELLKASHELLRVNAAGALARIQIRAPDAMPILEAGLNSANPQVRAAAAELFPRDDQGISTIMPVLIAGMEGTNAWVAHSALIVVLNLDKSAHRQALPGLIAALGHPSTGVRSLAAHVITGLGPDAKAAVPGLIAELNDPLSQIHLSAVNALAAIGPGAHAAIPALLNLFNNKSVWRGNVERALQQIGLPTVDELPGVLRALKHANPVVRVHAIDCLERAPIKITKPALPALVEALKDDEPHVRRGAAHALYNATGRDASVAVPLLVGLLKDPDKSVRAAVLHVFGWFGPLAKAALPALMVTLDDSDAWVRELAADRIARMGK